MLNAGTRLVGLGAAVVVLLTVAGLGDRPTAPAGAHGGGRHIEFGALGTGLDADTIRKVEPRRLTITAGETVTFHVNGSGHQVLVLKAGVDIEAIGAEGIDADRSLPDTPLAPEVYPQRAAGTGAGPVAGPGRWDANGMCPGGAGDVLRPDVFYKQLCGPGGAAVVDVPVTFATPGRYVFICNLVIHYMDEGTLITGPTGSAPIDGYGMHGEIEVVPR